MNNSKYIVEVPNKETNENNFDEKSFLNELIKNSEILNDCEANISAIIAKDIS